MFEVTMTHIFLPTYLWKNLPFWVHDKIKDEFRGNIILEIDKIDMEEKKDWTYVQLSSTNGDKALNFIKDLIPTFAAKVDHDDAGYFLAYAQRNGDQIYTDVFGKGEGSGDDNENEEDESEDGLFEASYDARECAIGAIEDLFGQIVINKIPLCLNEDEFNLILKKVGVDGVSKAIKIANSKKVDDIYLITCMRYVASSGVKEDVEKLVNFYIEETPLGNPIAYDSKTDTRCVEYRIVYKGDSNIQNEIPGNIYLVPESDIESFDSKGKEAVAKCISSNKDYVFSSDKWFCVNRKTHKNAPKWLNISNVYFDVLVSNVLMDRDGELGNYKHCDKIICNGKELSYLIVGHDRTGTQTFPNMLIIYTSDFENVPIKDKDIFSCCYCERSEKYFGSAEQQYNVYVDTLKKDICRIDNVYIIDEILRGLTDINGIYYSDLQDIKSVSFSKSGGVIIKKDGAKIEFKLR